jgi:hypothetical protein
MNQTDDFSCDPSKWSDTKLAIERIYRMPAVLAEYERRMNPPPKRDFDFNRLTADFMKARMEEGLDRYETMKVEVTIKSYSSSDAVLEIQYSTGEIARITIERIK